MTNELCLVVFFSCTTLVPNISFDGRFFLLSCVLHLLPNLRHSGTLESDVVVS